MKTLLFSFLILFFLCITGYAQSIQISSPSLLTTTEIENLLESDRTDVIDAQQRENHKEHEEKI
ncbi:MAG: hypothetical protein K9H64_05120 [Bacteroidales bacterium]|nr:hypothetical protein [Bacteroidales bacterium]MCF8455219.1 hypothetical protein [Bacteroidales bacterium]